MREGFVVKLTLEEATRLGIVVCKNCGWWPNNHFANHPKLCAHDSACPGYVMSFRVGTEIKQ